MTIQEIKSGESKNLEFKASRPHNSNQYMKTVVAFANGMGGKLVFGVDDKTRNIVGIPSDKIFEEMDAVVNAISDSCEPAILPDIFLQTFEEKTVIVVEIHPGYQRPYCIKQLGLKQGVFVRVAGTTRQADDAMLRELVIEGSNRSYDRVPCIGKEITMADVDELCQAMYDAAQKYAKDEVIRQSVKKVNLQQLISWGVVIEQEGKLIPTNAYDILTGKNGTVIQCGVFKGETKAYFVDRREFGGFLWEQANEAFLFVLRNIHLGAEFQGLYRQDVYEIPAEAIRELILNAVVHRSYIDSGNIQVAIFDNRLEVFSPGRMMMGQTLEQMLRGVSKIRNNALASAFSYMNLIEHWGSGMPKILGETQGAGLANLKVVGGDTDFWFTIYRRDHEDEIHEISEDSSEDMSEVVSEDMSEDMSEVMSEVASELQQQIIYSMQQNPQISISELSTKTGVSTRHIERSIKELREKGIVVRHGVTRKGYWEVLNGYR